MYHLVLFDYFLIDLLSGINICTHIVNRPHEHYSWILREWVPSETLLYDGFLVGGEDTLSISQIDESSTC